MEKEKKQEAKEEVKILKDVIEVDTHVPYIISGQFSDYKEGSSVSFVCDQLYCVAKIKYHGKNKVDYSINQENAKLRVSEIKDFKKSDAYTLKSIIFGVYQELKNNNLTEDLQGFSLKIDTNLKLSEGLEINIAISLLKAFNIIFDLKLDDFAIAEMVQKVISLYFGKVVTLLNVLAYFQKGVVQMTLRDRHLFIEDSQDNLDRYAFFLFEDGDGFTIQEHNQIFETLFSTYKKTKEYFHVNYLSEIPEETRAFHIFTQNSYFPDNEKFILTHYYEELKRSRFVLEGFKDSNTTTKLFDSLNLSTIELGAFVGFNSFEKFLENISIKSNYRGGECAETMLNESCFGKFVYIVKKEDQSSIFKYLASYKFFKITQLTVSTEPIEMYQIY